MHVHRCPIPDRSPSAMFKRLSLTQRLLAGTALAVTLAFGILLAITVQQSRQSAVEQAELGMRTQLDLVVTMLDYAQDALKTRARDQLTLLEHELPGKASLGAPVATGMWKDTLYAAPFKTNTQLLWYRKSLAAAAGVNPESSDFTWDEMIKAAVGQGKRVAVQGARYEGYMVWINALVLGAGGQIITNPEAGRNATPSLASEAGAKAAEIIGNLARSPAAAADLSTAKEEQARANFQGSNGMFMLNWPYVLAAARSAVEEGTLSQDVVDDIGWARYPRVFPDKPSQPPLGGANLAIGAYTRHSDLAVQLVECVNALPKATQYMLDEGEPSPYEASYNDPKVREKYPNADLIRDSIGEGGPRPLTPYYVDVTGSVIQSWHPPASVNSDTPQRTDRFMADVLSGRRLL